MTGTPTPRLTDEEEKRLVGHTPGPWHFTEEDVDANDGSYAEGQVCTEVDRSGLSRTIAIVRVGLAGTIANGHLIAAAPTLLAELDAVRAQLAEASDTRIPRLEQALHGMLELFGNYGFADESPCERDREIIQLAEAAMVNVVPQPTNFSRIATLESKLAAAEKALKRINEWSTLGPAPLILRAVQTFAWDALAEIRKER